MKNIFMLLIIFGLASCQTLPQTSTPSPIVPTDTQSPTHTPTPTDTPTQIPRYSVSGIVFHDLNGDGIQGENEPPLQNGIVKIGELSNVSNKDGAYTINDVPLGEWNATIQLDGFPFISSSTTEYFSANKGLPITLNKTTSINIGLTQGVLTIPFSKSDYFYIYSWMDIEPTEHSVKRYDGSKADCGWIQWPTKPIIGTCDGHNGIDYVANEGTKILAMAPGVVFYVATPKDQVNECLNVFILHKIGSDYFLSQYGHNSQNLVEEGQTVNRGDPIALVGHSCTKLNHLHFAWLRVSRTAVNAIDGGQKRGIINDAVSVDTYRDIQNSDSVSFWTKDNDPQFSGQ